ncbi:MULTISPECIES: VOC family protein [unclassified Ruegeria]|uniref:VOC family protein n=1 Tax=unclassified Ruegeria TaxID=2625375 RepID=UPI0014888866|nr:MULTISPECIES: VOC family protein [unclassified Ruegeria]NOD63243.1 glyoxalase/bleomycin resistance/extradiol dioxygenase family protein [Ruegeria sp. HKCCD6109]NOD91584.1 glyoxalase/bleomycin resistance/extradiol dioxygenase family protein [Ruegeria sp. HKCCD4884]
MKLTPDIPAPSAILEAALYADDLDAAEQFYGEILNLERIQRVDNRHVFFRIGGSVLLIFNPDQTEQPPLNPDMPVPPHGARGPGHVCLVLSRDEIAAMRKHLLDWNIPVDAEFDWPSGARSLYVRDPAGNSVEFAEGHLWD